MRMTLTKWHIPNGTLVHPGDKLCDIETEKATQELEADRPGILRHLKHPGQTVTPDDPPFRIEPIQ